MALAIFDLDNTLLAGDSDYLWGCFLVAQGVVDAQHYEKTNQQFYEDYQAGTLDIYKFQAFSLEPLTRLEASQRQALQDRYLQEVIQPLISHAARKLVESHRARGDQLLIITATNRFITAPIAAAFGITELLATDPEILHGRYTGRIVGTPCYQQGKVVRLNAWLEEQQQSLNGSTFYSDSHNDLPLLNLVDHPVAVSPDDILRRHAQSQGWPILELHTDHDVRQA